MALHIYKIDCITNLHVGSGDINYNIVDNEVERDSVTGYPIIHSSGLKGALREHFEKKYTKDVITDIFGQESGAKEIKAGSYKFFDAELITRPMRVSHSTMASVSVASVDSINNFLKKLNAFGFDGFSTDLLKTPDFGKYNFLTSFSLGKNSGIEGETVGELDENAKNFLAQLKPVIGEKIAICKDFNEYDLPVISRNYLVNKESKNLWYEEVVPHNSVFYTIIITPDDDMKLDLRDIVQIGGHASIGCGYTKFTKLN